MPDQKLTLSMADLLKDLSKQGLISVNKELKTYIQTQDSHPDSPVYLKVLSGIGAFIACICFLGFLLAVDVISLTNETEGLIWSVILIGISIAIYRAVHDGLTMGHNFVLQVSFAFIATGKFLFVFSLFEWQDEDGWLLPLSCLFITAVTYPFYRLYVERFLSTCVVLIAMMINVIWNDRLGLPNEVLFNLFFLCQLGGAGFLLLWPKAPRSLEPVAQAFVIGLCASVLLLAAHGEFDLLGNDLIVSPISINILLSLSLIGLIIWAAGGMNQIKKEPIIVGIIGTVGLGLLSAPGVLLSIALMIFGYARHDRLFILLGTLLMPVFLWLYYYNLDISLLQKSIVLVCSGALLIGGKLYLKLKGWDRDNSPKDDHQAKEDHQKGEISCA